MKRTGRVGADDRGGETGVPGRLGLDYDLALEFAGDHCLEAGAAVGEGDGAVDQGAGAGRVEEGGEAL
jgi:hypothetical protein